MYDIIKNYVENDNSNGLILIDMPTGSGKTYSALQFIYKSCMEDANAKKKYIFVTTLKKNLQSKDLRKMFSADGIPEVFEEKVLVIDSNMESVINGFSDEIEQRIPDEIKRTDIYKNFRRDLTIIKNQRAENRADMRDSIQGYEYNLRQFTEPPFRKLVQKCMKKEFKTVNERLNAVKTNIKWRWVGELYPAVFTNDKQVLFMSMDKFLGRNSTIIDNQYMFFNAPFIKDSIIFIDEFDATKETMLNNIIKNGLRYKVNYVELFISIYSALHTDDFPADLTVPSKQRQESEHKNRSLNSIIEDLREKSEHIFKTYSLQYKHRTDAELDDNYQNYMFQDHQYHSILSDKNKHYITMYSDGKRKINTISFEKEKPSKENNNIQSMLGQLRGFIKYFQTAVNILAINYMQRKNEVGQKAQETFTMEYAINTILSLFRLSDDNTKYLADQIMVSEHKQKKEKDYYNFDLTFYERGFRYYAFVNNTDHDMQSQIMMYSFQTTPEKLLLKFCEKAKVIGISATATVPSVIGNYDISYLQDKLSSSFIKTTDEERVRLAENFNEIQSGYKDINITAALLGKQGSYSIDSWCEVFDNTEMAEYVFDLLQRSFSDGEDSGNYHKERYLRIALAFKQFISHKDIRSFLCVLTKYPKTTDRELNKTTLQEIFKFIAQDSRYTDYSDSTVAYLDGADYEEKKARLLKRLSEGEKIFVISVYQTIGAGQNLQYPVPDIYINDVVRVNSRSNSNEKDFDAIYLEKPTNLIVQLVENIQELDFAKYIYQMEFLQEKGELSSDDTVKNIKRAFKAYMSSQINRDPYANVYNKKSYVLMSTRYIIQAIGRLCRTGIKNKNVYIYADNRIADIVDVSVVKGRIFNPEFVALVAAIEEYGKKEPEDIKLEYLASLKSERVSREINNMLNNDWNSDKIKRWQTLRDLSLRFPTASSEDAASNFIIRVFYVELPEKGDHLYYSQDEDYNNVSVSFTKDDEHPNIVSMAESKLSDMLLIPGVKEYFIENGFAISYEPNDYIMTPTLWNNIYKGALGEVVGRFLFNKMLNIMPEEITDPSIFELFDFYLPGTSIYIDFKNWHEGYTEDKEGILRKIASKAEKCGCNCVIVANIIAEHDWPISVVDYEGVHIVSIPYLVKKEGGTVSYNQKAWDKIRECAYEYRN